MKSLSGRRLDPAGSVALVVTVACWGTIPVFLRDLTKVIDPWTANGVRYPLAALLYWPALIAAARAGALDRRLLLRAVVPGILSFLGQVFWALAPYHLPATIVSFLVKLSIVWAIVAAMLLFPDERPLLRSGRFWSGAILAAGGFVWLSFSRLATKAAEGGSDATAATAVEGVSAAGIAIILACGFFFGLYGVSVRWLLSGVRPILAFGLVAQLVSVGTITLMLLFGAPERLLEHSGTTWTKLVVSALLGIAISHTTYYFAIQRLGASLANVGHLVGPFITLALASVFLGEIFGWVEALAGAAMVSGGGLLLWSQEHLGGRRADSSAPAPPQSPAPPRSSSPSSTNVTARSSCASSDHLKGA